MTIQFNLIRKLSPWCETWICFMGRIMFVCHNARQNIFLSKSSLRVSPLRFSHSEIYKQSILICIDIFFHFIKMVKTKMNGKKTSRDPNRWCSSKPRRYMAIVWLVLCMCLCLCIVCIMLCTLHSIPTTDYYLLKFAAECIIITFVRAMHIAHHQSVSWCMVKANTLSHPACTLHTISTHKRNSSAEIALRAERSSRDERCAARARLVRRDLTQFFVVV